MLAYEDGGTETIEYLLVGTYNDLTLLDVY